MAQSLLHHTDDCTINQARAAPMEGNVGAGVGELGCAKEAGASAFGGDRGGQGGGGEAKRVFVRTGEEAAEQEEEWWMEWGWWARDLVPQTASAILLVWPMVL